MKQLFLLGLFVLLNNHLFSQGSFGIQWQMSNNQLLATKPTIDLGIKNTFSYSIALLYKLKFGRFSFQTGVGYMPVKYDFDFRDGNGFKSTLHYVNLPLQLNYSIPIGYKQAILVGIANDFNLRVATKDKRLFEANSPYYNENIRSGSKFLQVAPKFSLAYQIEILDEELLEIGLFSSYELMNYKLNHYPHFFQERATYSIIGRAHAFRVGIETKVFF